MRLTLLTLAVTALALVGALLVDPTILDKLFGTPPPERLGDIHGLRTNIGLAIRYDTLEFSPPVWRVSPPHERGRMLASLARQQRFVGQPMADVPDLLGPWDGYTDAADIPTYQLAYGETPFELVFWPDRTDRTLVKAVQLRADITE